MKKELKEHEDKYLHIEKEKLKTVTDTIIAILIVSSWLVIIFMMMSIKNPYQLLALGILVIVSIIGVTKISS